MVNERQAFKLLKKSSRRFICKEDGNYYVSNGHFIIKTADTEKLIELGLIDFKENVRENESAIKEKLRHDKPLKLVTKTDFIFSTRIQERILVCADKFMVVNELYYMIFSDCEMRTDGNSLDAIYCYENKSEFVGIIMPIYVEGLKEEIEMLCECSYTASSADNVIPLKSCRS